MPEFSHLHTHSNYSLLQGACTLQDLCQAAKQLGMETLALTDTNGFYGLINFLQTAREYDLTPLVGAEVKSQTETAVLLAKSRQGYAGICRIICARHLQPEFSLLQWLCQDREEMVVLSRDLRLLDQLARRTGRRDLYVELQPGQRNRALMAFAQQSQLAFVATNPVSQNFVP